MSHVICLDPRNSEAPGRRLNVVAWTQRSVADDHVVSVFLLEEGYVLFRSDIGGSQRNTLLTPGSVGALRDILGVMPDAW